MRDLESIMIGLDPKEPGMTMEAFTSLLYSQERTGWRQN